MHPSLQGRGTYFWIRLPVLVVSVFLVALFPLFLQQWFHFFDSFGPWIAVIALTSLLVPAILTWYAFFLVKSILSPLWLLPRKAIASLLFYAFVGFLFVTVIAPFALVSLQMIMLALIGLHFQSGSGCALLACGVRSTDSPPPFLGSRLTSGKEQSYSVLVFFSNPPDVERNT